MEVSKHVFQQIQETAAQFISHPNYELEAKFIERVSKDAFVRALQYFKANGWKEQIKPPTLDISFKHGNKPFRLSISGKDNIQKYCMTNKFDSSMVSEHISKTMIPKFPSIVLEDIAMKIDLRREEDVTEIKLEELVLSAEAALKGYRYKQRFSYTSASSPFRFDFTVVKRSRDTDKQYMIHKDFACSGVTSSMERFEIECECVKRENAKQITLGLLKHMAELYAVINGMAAVLPKSERESALKEYLSLWVKNPDLDEVAKRPRKYFMGPQPVTLEQANVITDGVGVNTIISDYTVTEKADGERCLLYITKQGKAYFLNSKLEVLPTGLEFNTGKQTVIDGELITKDLVGNKISMYAMFDLYYMNGEPMTHHPLIEDGKGRLDILKDFVKKHKTTFDASTTSFYVKRFLHGEDIFKSAKYILDQEKLKNFAYRIDGLIFTPKNLAVGGYYKADKGELFGAWSKLYKWKPPAENTIDFKVKEQKNANGSSKVTVKDGQMYKMYHIYVGYKPSQWEPITATNFISKNIKNKNNVYTTDKLFTPNDELDTSICEFYGQINEYGDVVCKNQDIFEDDKIIEFAYINDSKIAAPYRWVPLRIRKDKTAPNDFGPAMNVWRSIHQPVTETIICGEKKVYTKDVPEDNVYYKRSMDRDKFASKAMMNFHSYWNKNVMLYSKFKDTNSLMDIACGKGGDIKKWYDAGINKVFGVDYSRDNIENPVDGAYSRLLQYQSKDYNGWKDKQYVFLNMDASKVIDREYIETMPNKEDQQLARKLWGISGLESDPYFGFAKDKFDLVSCMFAIHYFFENEQKLDAFIKNVNNNLRPGGHFIGTCLDGLLVKKALKDVKTSASITGKLDDRILWNIQKLYDNETENIGFGEEIQIYMESIGREANEYLVNMKLLIDKLAAYDIVPVKIQSFQETYQYIMNMKAEELAAHTPFLVDEVKKMTEEEKKYSFLNCMFIFQKKATSPQTAKKIVKKQVVKAI